MKSSGLLLVFCLLPVRTTFAQPALIPSEGFNVGGIAGPGTAGLLAATRVSMPASPRVSFDIDVGLIGAGGDRTRSTAGAQLRWLRTERRSNGSSDYGIFGLMYAREERRTEIRFPDAHIIRTERVNGLSPVVGYGVDWLSPTGTRFGLELTGGGNDSAGPRLFAKFFATFGLRP